MRPQNRADLAMFLITMVWGLNFIVIKEAFIYFQPLTFNALRFMLGATVMIPIAVYHQAKMSITWQDARWLFFWTLLGLVGYQVLLVTSLRLTNSTNAALLVATMPTWTALIGMTTGDLHFRWGIVLGLMVTFCGVTLVVFSHDSASLALSGHDMLGSLIALGAAVTAAIYTMVVQPLLIRYNGLTNAIYKHWFTCFGLVVIASPDLITLRPSDFPLEVWPFLLFSAIFASVGGYVVSNYALGILGPTRTNMYNNFSPLVTAIASVILLKEHITLLLIAGGLLVLAGISCVRYFGQKPVGAESASPATPALAAGD